MTPSSQELKSIKIIYAAPLFGTIFFLILASVLVYKINGPFQPEDRFFEKLLLSISILMAIVSIPSGLYIFKKRTSQIEKLNVKEKIETYRSAMILRAATMEGSCFFFIICFLLQGSNIFFLLSMSVISLMLYFFPTNNRIAEEIKHDLRKLEQ